MTTPALAEEHQYTYLFCDLITDELLAELPLQEVQYGTELNGIGTLRATVPYNDQTLPLDPETATTPGGRTALWVDRDGVIVWGGIVWTRDATTGGKTIQAAEFLSYFQHRTVKQTLSSDLSLITNTAYVPDGQRLYLNHRHIVWSLLRYAEAQPGGNVGFNINPLVTAAGPNERTTYPGYERPEIYKAIADLAASEDGFDFGVEVGWTNPANNEPPTRYKRVKTWYPSRGRTADESGLVFTKGGGGGSNIIAYAWPENGTEMATQVSAIGEGEGEATLQITATATDLLDAGWPLLERVSTHQTVETSRLIAYATGELAAASQSGTQPWFDVEADTAPAFGSYTVGDRALFIIDPEPRMPNGRQAELRIVSMSVTASRGPERVRLTCAAV